MNIHPRSIAVWYFSRRQTIIDRSGDKIPIATDATSVDPETGIGVVPLHADVYNNV
jgi:hypothetical protein